MPNKDYYNKRLAQLKTESKRLQNEILELEMHPTVQEYINLKRLQEWNNQDIEKTKKLKKELPFEPLFVDTD